METEKEDECPHFEGMEPERMARARVQLEEIINNKDNLECSLCRRKCGNLSICVSADCMAVLCPIHSTRHPHPFRMSIDSQRFSCVECDELSEESEPEWTTERPKGVSGLPNLGNTCYINSALQALVNTPPLVHYFSSSTVADLQRRFERKENSVSIAFHRLIQSMWRRSEPPLQLLYTIRCAHPMFRGFQQQDSQEFLRCLMDQLHEELKIPSYDYQRKNSDSESSDEDGDYETCDSGVSERSSLSEELNQIKPMSISRSPSPDPKRKSHMTQPSTPSKNKKIIYKSIISEVFDGTLLSSVQCLTCNLVSSRVETFQDLSLPIPSRDHLSLLHQTPQQPKCSHLYHRQQGWYSWLWDWIHNWLWGPSISLQDCLAAFFSADELKGDNMYSCGKCNKLRNGVKFSKVLKTPEVLCIHLKRFRHDLVFSSKISGYIKFPMEGLDLKPFLQEDANGVTKYNLSSVICHHGPSGSGGHYTCYALNTSTNQWYHYDDLSVTRVTKQTVAACQAYVLFYRKDSSKANRRRKRLRVIEEGNAEDPNILISNDWFTKFESFSWPGPIDNRHLESGDSALDDHVRVTNQGWLYLYGIFGGGPKIISPYTKIEDDETYPVSAAWLKSWNLYTNGISLTPPGPVEIGNEQTYELSAKQWEFLVKMHGLQKEEDEEQEEPEVEDSDTVTNL